MAIKPERAGQEALAFAPGLQRLEALAVRLAVAFVEFGLGVEKIDLARAAHLHEHDDRPGSRRKMARPCTQIGSIGPACGIDVCMALLLCQEMGQRQSTKAERRLLQERTTAEPGHRPVMIEGRRFHGHARALKFTHESYSANKNSLVLNSVKQICVSASRDASSGRIPAERPRDSWRRQRSTHVASSAGLG